MGDYERCWEGGEGDFEWFGLSCNGCGLLGLVVELVKENNLLMMYL